MFGGSYVGATQMLAAIGHPPHLAGICPVVTASNYHENWTYQGGAFEQWFDESWTSGLAQDTLNRSDPPQHQRPRRQHRSAARAVSRLQHRPGCRTGAELTQASRHISSTGSLIPTTTATGSNGRSKRTTQNIQVPALTVAAWYDIFQGGSLRNYLGIKAHGGNEAARNGQQLLVTIGGHAGGGRKIGEVDFGPQPPSSTRTRSCWTGTTTCFKASRTSSHREAGQDVRDGRKQVAR